MAEQENKYEIVMRTGDRAEARSLTAALRAVEQLYEDAGIKQPTPLTAQIFVNGRLAAWATTAAWHHMLDKLGLEWWEVTAS